MALNFWEASLAAAARRAGCPFDSVLMLGRQSSLLDRPALEQIGQLYQVDMQNLAQESWAEPFFCRLGATRVASLDYSDYEGASLIHDMNRPWPEGQPLEQFDIVFDGGTLEHIFNLPQALLNAMSLVKPGGALLSVSPADGWLSHGFYQLQPELFFRFLTPENGFRLRGIWLAESDRTTSRSRLFALRDPAVSGCRPLVPGRRPLALLSWAEKTREIAAPPTWPGQSNYTTMWQQGTTEASTPRPGAATSLKRALLSCLPPALIQPLRRWQWQRHHVLQARRAWQAAERLEPAPAQES